MARRDAPVEYWVSIWDVCHVNAFRVELLAL